MFRSTIAVISMLLLCLLFIPTHSHPTNKNGRNRSTHLNRQKRTFGFGFLGSRDWSPFYQTWRVPTFSTMPGYIDVLDEEDMFSNVLKKISVLENNQKRIINYLQKLHDDKNANPCEVRRTDVVSPSLSSEPQFPVESGIVYREPLATSPSISTASPSFGVSSEEPVTELSIEYETTLMPEIKLDTSAELSSSEESDVSLEPELATTIAARAAQREGIVHVEAVDFTEKNDVF